MKRGIIVLATMAMVCVSTGCVTMPSGAPQGPFAWQEGYAAGCDSGYKAAGNPYYQFRKHQTRYVSDPLYKSGWDDGFAVCKGSYESIRRW